MLIMGVPRGDLTEEDIGLLETIVEIGATDSVAACAMIHAYYRDGDRADRTPRGIMYLHLGILAGTIMKLARPH